MDLESFSPLLIEEWSATGLWHSCLSLADDFQSSTYRGVVCNREKGNWKNCCSRRLSVLYLSRSGLQLSLPRRPLGDGRISFSPLLIEEWSATRLWSQPFSHLLTTFSPLLIEEWSATVVQKFLSAEHYPRRSFQLTEYFISASFLDFNFHFAAAFGFISADDFNRSEHLF